jgi:hypothetical protein
MSEPSPPAGADSRPLCREHEGEPAPMERAILQVHFPRGRIPANGWRCPACGDEVLTGRDAREVEQTAKRLGLYGLQHETVRKVTRIGDSVGVTLAPGLLQDANLQVGDEVVIGSAGGAIILRSASEDAPPPRQARPPKAGKRAPSRKEPRRKR